MKRLMIPCLVILLTAAVFSGCTTVHAPKTPYAEWAAPYDIRQEQQDDPTWKKIREIDPDLSQPLHAGALLDLAMRNNPDTRQAWQQARAAEAEVRKAQGAYYPQVTVSGKGGYQKSDDNAEKTDIDVTSYGPRAELDWLLLDMGGRAASVEQTVQALMADNYDFNDTVLSLIQAVRKAYYGLYSAQQTVKAAQSNVNDNKQTLEATRAKTEAGLGIKLDVLQAETEYYSSLYALEEARKSLKQEQAALALTVGLPADAPIAIADPEQELPGRLKEDDILKVINEALLRRPDVNAQQAHVAAARAAVQQADSALWPTLNLGASAEYSQYDEDPSDAGNDDGHTYQGYLALSWDIFEGFKNISAKRAAEATLAAQQAALAALELKASQRIWDAFYAFQSAVTQRKFRSAALKSSQASYNLAMESYKAGIKSILDLLNAQTQLSNARTEMIAARQGVYDAFVDFAYETATLQTHNGMLKDPSAKHEANR
jgi:TolC family type I secretion outer membrane protein